MSSYGEPSVQHTSTVQQILDARERALNAVSLVDVNPPRCLYASKSSYSSDSLST